jgi:hypothetical protein
VIVPETVPLNVVVVVAAATVVLVAATVVLVAATVVLAAATVVLAAATVVLAAATVVLAAATVVLAAATVVLAAATVVLAAATVVLAAATVVLAAATVVLAAVVAVFPISCHLRFFPIFTHEYAAPFQSRTALSFEHCVPAIPGGNLLARVGENPMVFRRAATITVLRAIRSRALKPASTSMTIAVKQSCRFSVPR